MARRDCVVACLLLICVAVLGACGGGISSGESAEALLTPAQARAAAVNYDRVDAHAMAVCDAALNDTVETGDLAAIDDIGSINPPACTPRPSAVTPPASDFGSVFVPAGTSYPASFLSFATLDNGANHAPTLNAWVMQATGAGAPWKAVSQVKLFGQSSAPTFSSDQRGYAPLPLESGAAGYALTPAATCAAAAQFFTPVTAEARWAHR